MTTSGVTTFDTVCATARVQNLHDDNNVLWRVCSSCGECCGRARVGILISCERSDVWLASQGDVELACRLHVVLPDSAPQCAGDVCFGCRYGSSQREDGGLRGAHHLTEGKVGGHRGGGGDGEGLSDFDEDWGITCIHFGS